MFKLIKENINKNKIKLFILLLILILIQVYLDLKVPDYMSKITALIINEKSTLESILKEGLYMSLCALGSLTSAIFASYLVALISSHFAMNLRSKLYQKVLSFDLENSKKFTTGSLVTRSTSDVSQMEMFLAMGIQMLIKAPITALWAIFKILNKGWEWSLLTAGSVLILIIIIFILFSLAIPKFRLVQILLDKINNLIRENLIGVRVIRAFNAEEFQEKKFQKENKKLLHNQLFTSKIMSLFTPTTYFIMYILTISIYFMGAILIDQAGMVKRITIFSNMIVFSTYAVHIIMSFVMLSIIFLIYPRASVSAKRIKEVLKEEKKIKEGNFKGETKVVGEIEFRNVSFKYPDSEEYVLEKISFKVKKGETLAIVGRTGSGKSTILELILRFYDVNEGEIFIDGVNIKDYKLEELYRKIGYVPQKPVVFTGTIKDNICYGKNNKKKDLDIHKAIQIAALWDFVFKERKGLDSKVAREGTNVSGGEKERLQIARAILKNPEIYMFDDSFSALDYKTDLQVRQSLKEHLKDSTLLIVASRIGTIKNAEQILVIEEGKVQGKGTHEELLKNCSIYQDIFCSQFDLSKVKHE